VELDLVFILSNDKTCFVVNCIYTQIAKVSSSEGSFEISPGMDSTGLDQN